MTLRRFPLRIIQLVITLAAMLALSGEGTAQKKKGPPGPTLVPNLTMPFPAGMQRGTTLELQLTGTNLAGPLNLWTTIPGAKVTIPADNNNGKDNAKLKVNIEVPKEAPLGFHPIRLMTTRGLSNLRLFCVDDLPQVIKDGKNTSKEIAQAVPVPCVVAGTVGNESRDYYKITAQAAQRLSFEVLGRRLGSPFDPQLTIFDKDGKEVAFSNDAPGLQTDPRLTHTFKDAGDYVIEVRDVMHRGGGDYVYRLRIGDFPCATTPIPMAAKRGSNVAVRFAGPSVEGVPPVQVAVPADPAVDTVWVTPKGTNGLSGWPVALAVSDLEEVVEQEPNDDPAKANRVPVPGAVTGRFEQKNDIDHYALKLPKGRFIIEAHTHELGSPSEVYMELKNAKGGNVSKTNPQQAPRIDYNNPAEGEFILSVEHLHYWGGPAETYRVTITPYEPSFVVNLAADRADLTQGTGAILAIQSVLRSPDYKGPIELTVVGNPKITGQMTFTAPGGPAQPNQPPQGSMFLTAAPDLPVGVHPIRVQAKAMIDGKPVLTYANVKVPVGTALAALPYPPRNLLSEVAVGVGEKPPFTLTAKFDQPEAFRGTSTMLTITAARGDGFTEEIFLTPVGIPQGVQPVVKSIPAGANDVKIELKLPANAPFGEFPVSVVGRANFKDQDYGVTASPAMLVLSPPFDLKAQEKVVVDVGAKVKFKVMAARKAGYQGPITLAVQGLPTGVTAPAATIAQGQAEVEIELTAAANAMVGDKAGVTVLGTAPAAGNAQKVSPAFTVTVMKK